MLPISNVHGSNGYSRCMIRGHRAARRQTARAVAGVWGVSRPCVASSYLFWPTGRGNVSCSGGISVEIAEPSKLTRRNTEKNACLNAVDQNHFRSIIRRNIALPLGVGLVTMAVFVGLIAYLVSTMNWAEHSERVIGQANEMLRLAVDRESSMRGFLITGDESFLAPYEIGGPRFKTQIATCRNLVSDNPPQVEKLKQIQAIQAAMGRFRAADDRSAPPESGLSKPEVASSRGKIDIRRNAPRIRRFSRCRVAPAPGAQRSRRAASRPRWSACSCSSAWA